MKHYVNIDVDGFSIINNSVVVVVVVIVMPPFFTLLTFWKNGMVFHFISIFFLLFFLFYFWSFYFSDMFLFWYFIVIFSPNSKTMGTLFKSRGRQCCENPRCILLNLMCIIKCYSLPLINVIAHLLWYNYWPRVLYEVPKEFIALLW